MGLSERKVKQRIGADPRNLTWAENAAKFGHTYLAKHGWDPTMGLGVAGDGRVSHIAVAQKLDQLGIGAGRPDGPDAIAWKQAKEFEGLLERLNAGGEVEGTVEVVEETIEAVEENGEKEKDDKATRKERKREEKRKAKAALEASDSASSSASPKTAPVAAPAPRRLAHRARFLAAKRLAGTSSTALSEILGISSTPASISTPTSAPSTPTPAQSTLTVIPALDDGNQITTSSQSVADYFKNKMRAKAGLSANPTSSTPVVTFEEPEVDVPGGQLGSSRWNQDEDEEARPAGLGFSGASTGLGFRRAKSPSPSPPTTTTEAPLPTDSTLEGSDDRTSKKEKKRKRKEAEQTEVTGGSSPIEETEEDRKAAKRARKEARRAARQQQQQQEVETETGPVDRPKKKRKADKE